MLIITADDYGKNEHTTNSILECFANKRITSASNMVFMEDSERAALIALNTKFEMGLHLNFTQTFSSDSITSKLREHQSRVIPYLIGRKFSHVIHNPFLSKSFKYLFRSQHEEFIRLYGRLPDFINGHHHVHLCANMLLSNLIPKGTRLRKAFTFDFNEKGIFNFIYRRILNSWLSINYISTDCFFSISPIQNYDRLRKIFNQAIRKNIEIRVHPEDHEEFEFLHTDRFKNLIDSVPIGCFCNL